MVAGPNVIQSPTARQRRRIRERTHGEFGYAGRRPRRRASRRRARAGDGHRPSAVDGEATAADAAARSGKVEISDLMRVHRERRPGLHPIAQIRACSSARSTRSAAGAHASGWLSRSAISTSPILDHGVCPARPVRRGGNLRDLAPARARRAAFLVGGVRRRLEPMGKDLGWLALVSLFTFMIWLDIAVFLFLIFYGSGCRLWRSCSPTSSRQPTG